MNLSHHSYSIKFFILHKTPLWDSLFLILLSLYCYLFLRRILDNVPSICDVLLEHRGSKM
uniref:Uncharacterized protein n=1 Tax=Uncultured archaeon GZfos26G2 TaxID=3386331 RepID=Q649C3_UNCAG|nr:hypothetical protein GZ35B7_37 [uncultured archaeon GZfos35B7]